MKIILILMSMLIIGCSDNRSEVKSVSAGYKIVEIDGCEYIECSFSGYVGGSLLVHKANCKNPIHDWNKNRATDAQQAAGGNGLK